MIERVGRLLRLTEAKKRSLLQDATTPPAHRDILVADDLTWEEFAQVNVMAPELAGVSAEVGELRSYPLQAAFYHTIGYVAKANEADIQRMVEHELTVAGEAPDSPEGKARATAVRRLYKHPAMRVGKQGIEAFGEHGAEGRSGQGTPAAERHRPRDRPPAERGSRRQARRRCRAVDRRRPPELCDPALRRSEAGSAVMIDVATGEVICMMSTPAPDPNLFVSGIANTPYKALREDERNPLYHKAYDGVYPPGSTFKIVGRCGSAGIRRHGSRTDTIHCSGKAWYYNRFYNCWKPEGHGTVNLRTRPADVVRLLFLSTSPEKTGIEEIAKVAKRLGLGHRYELGITGGKSGVVPNNEWKLNQPRIKDRWYRGRHDQRRASGRAM